MPNYTQIDRETCRVIGVIGFMIWGDYANPMFKALGARVRRHETATELCYDEVGHEIIALYLNEDIPEVTMAHELGHAYHCAHWPELSAVNTPDRRLQAEITAMYAERLYCAEVGIDWEGYCAAMGRMANPTGGLYERAMWAQDDLELPKEGSGFHGVHAAMHRVFHGED